VNEAVKRKYREKETWTQKDKKYRENSHERERNGGREIDKKQESKTKEMN
jgi:hypothetical protein